MDPQHLVIVQCQQHHMMYLWCDHQHPAIGGVMWPGEQPSVLSPAHDNSSTLSSKCFCCKQIYLQNQVSIYSITCICDDLVYLCVFTAAVTLNVLQD